MSPYDPYSDPFIGSVNNDAIRNMAVAFQSCNLTSSPFDVPVTPIGWEPGLTSSFLLVRLFVPWDIADSHAVWIGLDNMVFDAIFVKQIHSGLSMTAGGESQFERNLVVDRTKDLTNPSFVSNFFYGYGQIKLLQFSKHLFQTLICNGNIAIKHGFEIIASKFIFV